MLEKMRQRHITNTQELFDKAHCVEQVVRLAMQSEMQIGPKCRMEVAKMAAKRIAELSQ